MSSPNTDVEMDWTKIFHQIIKWIVNLGNCFMHLFWITQIIKNPAQQTLESSSTNTIILIISDKAYCMYIYKCAEITRFKQNNQTGIQIMLNTTAPVSLWNTRHFFFLAFGFFIDKTVEDRKQVEREGQWRTAKGPRLDSNPGPLQRGQSLCRWDACSTCWPKQCPRFMFEVRNTECKYFYIGVLFIN